MTGWKQVAKTQIDTGRLFAVLEARTTDEHLSWRQAANQIGVSPSLLSRLRYGQRPDLDGYASIVRWLRMSADDFIEVEGDDVAQAGETSLITEISALLRKRRDLTEADKSYIEDVVRASLDHIRRSKAAQEQDGRS
jgi:transcriptional regulator with XRE-family HTH domain